MAVYIQVQEERVANFTIVEDQPQHGPQQGEPYGDGEDYMGMAFRFGQEGDIGKKSKRTYGQEDKESDYSAEPTLGDGQKVLLMLIQPDGVPVCGNINPLRISEGVPVAIREDITQARLGPFNGSVSPCRRWCFFHPGFLPFGGGRPHLIDNEWQDSLSLSKAGINGFVSLKGHSDLIAKSSFFSSFYQAQTP